jgi:hypothetical protein
MNANQGIASFLKAKGVGGWPDIEVGGPGFCFPVLRWNGSAYKFNRHQMRARPAARQDRTDRLFPDPFPLPFHTGHAEPVVQPAGQGFQANRPVEGDAGAAFAAPGRNALNRLKALQRQDHVLPFLQHAGEADPDAALAKVVHADLVKSAPGPQCGVAIHVEARPSRPVILARTSAARQQLLKLYIGIEPDPGCSVLDPEDGSPECAIPAKLYLYALTRGERHMDMGHDTAGAHLPDKAELFKPADGQLAHAQDGQQARIADGRLLWNRLIKSKKAGKIGKIGVVSHRGTLKTGSPPWKLPLAPSASDDNAQKLMPFR